MERKQKIHELRTAGFKNDLEERARKAQEQAEEKERLLRQVEEMGGLWEAELVSKNLKKHSTEREKRFALKIQLNFRQKVLGAKCDRTLFHMSSGGKNKTVSEITENLLAVIKYCSPKELETDEISEVSEIQTSSALPEHVLNAEKERFSKEAKDCEKKLRGENEPSQPSGTSKPKSKTTSKKNKSSSAKNEGQNKKKKLNVSGENQVPTISCPEDLIGKLI